MSCFEGICNDGPNLWSSDSVTDARSLQLAVSTTDFISSLVITNCCLKYLHSLTTSLQSETKDIVAAVNEISNVKEALQSARNNIHHHHNQWFRTVEQLCSSVGIEPLLPRRCSRQVHRINLPADTPSTYDCRSISIQILDHLLTEIESRFSTHQQTALLGLMLVPSVLVHLTLNNCTSKTSMLAEMYKVDLLSPDSYESELHCWLMKWQKHLHENGEASLTTTPASALRHDTAMFPNIRSLLSIICTLPVTTCSAERSFSALKRIKTHLRSSMGTERLTGLALLHIHRDIPLQTSDIIDEFAWRHPRKLQLFNIFAD